MLVHKNNSAKFRMNVECLPLFVLICLFCFGNMQAKVVLPNFENEEIVFLQEHNLTISSTSTKADLHEIEAYFFKNHPKLLVKFDNVSMNSEGRLIAFNLQIKFKGDTRFHTRLKKPANAQDWSFRLEYAAGPSLKVYQMGERTVTMVFTKDEMKFN